MSRDSEEFVYVPTLSEIDEVGEISEDLWCAVWVGIDVALQRSIDSQ